MKKLLATMLLSLGMSSMAAAQSSVTIYGLLDVGFSGRSINGNPPTATNTATTNQLGNSFETPSRLGFRGTEDLGGGTSAFFTIETGITANSPSMSAMNNRQSFVGLRQKGLGSVAIGTQYGPIWEAYARTEPTGMSGVIGSVLSPAQGTENGQSSSDAAVTVRFNNAITVKTETFKGFSAKGLYSVNSRDAYQTNATTGGNNNNTAWALGVDYAWKDLYAVVAYQSLKNLANGTTPTVTAGATGTIGGSGITYVAPFTAVNASDNQLYVGATYDFKIVKAYAGYIDRKITSALNPNAQLNRTAQQIGIRGFYAPKLEGWASVGNGRYQAFGTNNPTANFTGYQVGSNYWLSKRTNLYAIYGSTQTASTSGTGAFGGTQYATGIRYTF